MHSESFISLRVLEMNKKTLVHFVSGFRFWRRVHGAGAKSTEAPRNVPASAIDDQGRGRYLVGPGDILDVSVFGHG